MGWSPWSLFTRKAPPKPVDEKQADAALVHLMQVASALDLASKDDAEIVQFAGEVRDIAFRLGGRNALRPKAPNKDGAEHR
jgi:hypothetical protein